MKTRKVDEKRLKKPERGKGASTLSPFSPNQCSRAVAWGESGVVAVATNHGYILFLNEEDLSMYCSINTNPKISDYTNVYNGLEYL